MIESDFILLPGGECKALGDGKVGGYLVVFGSADAPDLVGDYFTADTDFRLGQTGAKSVVLFDHGLDPTLGKSIVGEVSLKVDAKGVWAEGVLKARESYSAAVKEIIGKDLPDLIAGKKLGWSSGTAAHLVERKKVGAAYQITTWPLGLDASLTATPCEPRTLAVPLKQWLPSFAKGIHLGTMAEPSAAMAAVQHLHGRLHEQTWQHMGDEKALPAERMKRIGKAYDECKTLSMKCMKALMGGDGAEGDEAKALANLEAFKQICLDAEMIELQIDCS
jgi:hypothetical protein